MYFKIPHLCVCVNVCRCVWVPKEARRGHQSAGSRVTDGFETCNTDAASQTWVFWKERNALNLCAISPSPYILCFNEKEFNLKAGWETDRQEQGVKNWQEP